MKACSTNNPSLRVLLALSLLLLVRGKSFAQGADVCSNVSTALSVGTTCTSKLGNLASMTKSTGVPAGCGDANSADIWYKFVAGSPWPTINLQAIAANFRAATPVIQLYSGTCGSLTSLGCVSGNTSATTLSMPVATAVSPTGLTPGSTYYIRVYTKSNTGTISGSGWTFTICVTDPSTPTVDNGKSYVNITKGTTGGTVEPGDVLEIRATMVVKSNGTFATQFKDVVPANTSYIPNTLRILTNEGKIYKQFTDAADGDAATISGSNITINMGAGATSSAGGYVANTSKPNFYGSTCIMVVSFRVQVTGAYGTQINVGNGSITYNTGSAPTSINFPAYNIAVFKSFGLCSNSVGTNALINESGGTFGSGNVKDRAASNKVPSNYTYAPFSSGSAMPQDYYYGVSNNTSGGPTTATGYATSNTAWAIPDNGSPSHRIFGVWDIIGDHTNASNPLLGNPPTDDLNGASGGYMVVVNAAYRTDTAFLDTVYNLCPNTYYQYTAWFRNICSRCGCDSNGTGAGSSGYIPTAPGDSSGVYPNLTFNINGYDYYSTGNLLHTGQWERKGFTYLTGPTQTTMIVSIRNNAPGGGGNDWAIDDIGVASCYPSMVLTPNKPDTLCMGGDDTVRFKVTSFFDNFTEWKLEQSKDNGVTWTSPGIDTTGKASSGTGTPVYNAGSGLYEYLVTRYYRLSLVDPLIKYRIIVGSTVGNLANPNCSFITMSPKIVYAVNCNQTLPVRIISFRGQARDGKGWLQWVSADEPPGVIYTVESSDDGSTFTPIGTIHGQAVAGNGATYQLTDPGMLAGPRFYRIRISSGPYTTYSSQVMISDGSLAFAIRKLENPFTNDISMEVVSPGEAMMRVHLIDMYGRVVARRQQQLSQGLNVFDIGGLGQLANGTYILQMINGEKVVTRKVVKYVK